MIVDGLAPSQSPLTLDVSWDSCCHPAAQTREVDLRQVGRFSPGKMLLEVRNPSQVSLDIRLALLWGFH
jgi:hypothetical protein